MQPPSTQNARSKAERIRDFSRIAILALFGLLISAAIVSRTIRGEPSSTSPIENRQSKIENPLPPLATIPDFRLTDSHDTAFTLAQLHGKVWVADFVFTTCAGPCPEMSAQMAELQREFTGADDVHFVSVSVNPEYDTPQILAGYAQAYGADTTRWHFLTGARDDIHRLAVQGFKLGSIDEPVFHSTKFALVDRGGHIRGYYEGTDPQEVTRLAQDIRRLLGEPTE